MHMQVKRKSSIDLPQLSVNKIPQLYEVVEDDCNMIEFAKSIRNNYHPDSGIAFFELTTEHPEYISSSTEVVLIDEVKSSYKLYNCITIILVIVMPIYNNIE